MAAGLSLEAVGPQSRLETFANTAELRDVAWRLPPIEMAKRDLTIKCWPENPLAEVPDSPKNTPVFGRDADSEPRICQCGAASSPLAMEIWCEVESAIRYMPQTLRRGRLP